MPMLFFALPRITMDSLLVPRHDGHHHHHATTGDSTAEIPSLVSMQVVFWAFIVSAITALTISAFVNRYLAHQRIAQSSKLHAAARPSSFFFQVHATMTAIKREFCYYSPLLTFGRRTFRMPSGGTTITITAYASLTIACCFYKFHPQNLLEWESIAYRAGYIALCQLPLTVLLAGKRNLIGLFIASSYERLNWLHRWTARCLLLTILIHAGFWLREWGEFGFILTKIQDDSLTRRGIAAGLLLVWLVLSSAAPIRNLAYEFFVVQHLISWLGLLVAIYLHVPQERKIWIWLSFAAWAVDRLVRLIFLLRINLAFLHAPKSRGSLFSCKGHFEVLDEEHLRLVIDAPPMTWKAGQHVLLTCPSLAPFTAHPFSIASLPADGRMEFTIRAKHGTTRKFWRHAASMTLASAEQAPAQCRNLLIEGPYSRIRPLRQFDSLVFIAGTTGAAFTLPLMREVVQHWSGGASPSRLLEPPPGAVTRKVRFIWMVRRSTAIIWFREQLMTALAAVAALRNRGVDVALEITVHVTGRDDDAQSSDMLEPNAEAKSQQLPAAGGLESLNSFEILRGRPDLRSLIRRSAEMALGEMAVVACGPRDLAQLVRAAVASISNERAVHKGTGAQGIWCHTAGL
ncbi:BgTH12-05325 [Blumeria graminis f. sp. triticale]|uniref:BgTH12-05325 n=1 Tax=Blumeria graminis f. sp. triticale TaxID=1689686 RepID=A0A9W4D179_BLUGR|nr:BgTH12-05325 [Blumeria graminis f. sp. triticale]